MYAPGVPLVAGGAHHPTRPGSDVQWQSYLWAGNTVSFGTISH
jgi:hypothetical protein